MTKFKNKMISLALVCLIGFQPAAFGARSTYTEIIAAWFANLRDTVSAFMKAMTSEDRQVAKLAAGAVALTGLAAGGTLGGLYMKRRADIQAQVSREVDSLRQTLDLRDNSDKKSDKGLGGLYDEIYGDFPIPIIWSLLNLRKILESESSISPLALRELIKREELYIKPSLLLDEVTTYKGFDDNLAQRLGRETAALKVYCDKHFRGGLQMASVRPWKTDVLEKWKNNSTDLKQPLNNVLIEATKENK